MTALRGGDEERRTDVYALEEVLDGELTAARAERLRQHLERCPECADEVERARRIKQLVRRSCCEPAPAGLRERITIEYRRVSVTVRRPPPGA